MKKTLIKIIAIFTFLTLSTNTIPLEARMDTKMEYGGNIYYASEEEINKEIERQVAEYISGLQSNARVPEYFEYKTEYGPSQLVSATGYVGGIPVGGVSFKYGGSVSVNIHSSPNISVGTSYYGVSLSISLPMGSQAAAMQWGCNIPAGGYYRVKNTRTDTVRSATVYGKNQYGTWVKIGVAYPHAYYSHYLFPVKVS